MKHKHHIIPKHAGGTDDPSNLVELTVEEHAEAHRVLWEKYDRWQDYLAWQGLSGRMGKEDLIREKIRLANLGKKPTEETLEKMRKVSTGRKHTSEAKLKMSILATGKKPTEETRQKLIQSHLGKKQTEESKKKSSESIKKWWAERKSKNN